MKRKLQKCETNSEKVATRVEQIMASVAFRHGVADVRCGRPPRFDTETEGGWLYDWGRQFAVLAPLDMPIVMKRKRELNPRAIELFCRLKPDII
jgi:hypothetical protein